jgi:hypothetical protein
MAQPYPADFGGADHVYVQLQAIQAKNKIHANISALEMASCQGCFTGGAGWGSESLAGVPSKAAALAGSERT